MFTASDQMLQCPQRPLGMDRRWKSNTELAPNCPRCASPNTKFCYYNNYSLSQPRYFCKGCRRYWTKGGSLRNVPIGGGCRKNRRSKSTRPDPVSVGTCSSADSPGSPGGTLSGDPSTATPGPDIDLAAVFAKFLNQNGGEATGRSDQPDHRVLMEAHEASDQMSQTQLQGHDPDAFVDNDPRQEREFVGHDKAASELQMLVGGGEEVEQDVLWAEAATALSSFEWQPMVQLQELGQFSLEEQSKVSPMMMDDYWNSFDPSAYEVLSRP